MNKSTLTTEDADFVPTLLAIQENPPPKMPRFILLSVAALFVILLLWACFGKIDVVASAEGRLVPQTWVKIVQPADAGIIVEILVQEGQQVAAGEVLMRMDAGLVDADARTTAGELAIRRLQLARIDAELGGQPLTMVADDPPELFSQVSRQYQAHRQTYLDGLAQEKANLDKTRHDLQAAQEILTKLRKVLPSYQRSAKAYEKLGKDGFFSTLAAEEKQRDQLEKEQDLRAQQATVESLGAMQQVSENKLAQMQSAYQSALRNERAETDSALKKLREEQEKIRHKSGLLTLRAPQAGIVKDLATHTTGTVVAPGTILMSLVPQSEPLQAEVLIKNEDIGFVHVGQQVQIKLAAYPFQKYGMIAGIIEHIGPDTTEKNGTTDKPDTAGYRALVRLARQQLQLDNTVLPLTAGMQIVVDIQQGRRTVMAYLLSPVQKAWQEAARER
jgi:HlyD family secretion protein